MNDQSLLQIALIYLAVIRSSLLALLAMNVVTFFMYGIDKWRSISGRLLPKGRKKAKKYKWRISEATLLGMAVIGGSIGAWLGMRVWHHKTLHKKFKYGVPAIIIVQLAIIIYYLYEQ